MARKSNLGLVTPPPDAMLESGFGGACRKCGALTRAGSMGAKVSPELPIDGSLGEEIPVDLFEITGIIKWFDASKGYGFVVPDDGGADVLLHVTCLRRGGFQTAYEGARVICEVLDRTKGRQAFRVVSMDESTAVRPPQMAPSRTHNTVVPTSGLERATVKWFNRVRGYGFLNSRRGHGRYFRPHGNASPFWPRGVTSRADRPGAVRRWPEGADGSRNSA